MAVAGAEGLLVPAALIAVTVSAYALPVASPEMVHDRGPAVVHVCGL